MTSATWISAGLLILASSVASSDTGPKNESQPCVDGPPDYLCPTASLLQVYLQHEQFCTRYYKCAEGRAIEFQCPYGTYFNLENSTCTCDFTLCYRKFPCKWFIDSCRCCESQFYNDGLTTENFFVCYSDGQGLAKTCPKAYDPCSKSYVQLKFINGKCEVPPTTTPKPPTTTPPTTTTPTTTPTTTKPTTTTPTTTKPTTTTSEPTTTTPLISV